MAVWRTTIAVLLVLSSMEVGFGARKLAGLYQPPPALMRYHKGKLLGGELPLSVLWYGKFTVAQKSIILDFVLSLSPQGAVQKAPSVSDWWRMVERYTTLAKWETTHVRLVDQVSDEMCSLGKSLTRAEIVRLAEAAEKKSRAKLVLVLTDESVTVEGFCMNSCGFHESDRRKEAAVIWVGNSASQCPGYCAWPFHQPVYGPQGPPLVAPNNDVGVDGMVINVAGLLAGAVTNPFGNGFFQGPPEAPLEAATACAGIYGKGAYPGYAGELLVDPTTGSSYNAVGAGGRKYLLPALFDPSTSQCSTLV